MNNEEFETVIDGCTFELRTAIYKAAILSCDGHTYWDGLAPREQSKVVSLLTLKYILSDVSLHVTGRRKSADGTRKYSPPESASQFELLLSPGFKEPAVYIASLDTLSLVKGFIDVLSTVNPYVGIKVVYDSIKAYAGVPI